MERFYPIGTPGQPWTDAEKTAWFEQRDIVRSYRDDVRRRLDALGDDFVVEQYGALSIAPQTYPLLAATFAHAGVDAPWAVVTGGVHGYETSGVHGALAFLESHARDYAARLNLLVAPCVSPWGYEIINRWNPKAVDPNRSFIADSPSEEAEALMAFIASKGIGPLVHLDLHETTDSDEEEFRPALAARDGKPFEPGLIPDGFYTVADSENPQPEFQAAIIRSVAEVTHIAPPDENGQIIGADVTQPGVIHYPFTALGLCGGLTRARYTSTTEVYPDSPKATPEICVQAQVAALRGAFEHALAHA